MLRDIFLKTNNYIQGKYFAELIKVCNAHQPINIKNNKLYTLRFFIKAFDSVNHDLILEQIGEDFFILP